MKNILILLLLTFSFCTPGEQNNETREENSTSGQSGQSEDQTSYDENLANSLGADEYGMKKYIFAFLKAGPNRDQDEEEAAELQSAHLSNIRRLAEEGKLILAGPFMDEGEVRGIYIFDVRTIEEARKLTETDPAIQAGRLEMELRPWYGSAALMKVVEIHEKIAKENP